MDDDQERFLRDEFFSLTLIGTVQRNKVYTSGAGDVAKEQFQQAVPAGTSFFSEAV
jgi:hypothetical protein